MRLQSVEYQAVLAAYPAQLADALAAVHRAVEPAGGAAFARRVFDPR